MKISFIVPWGTLGLISVACSPRAGVQAPTTEVQSAVISDSDHNGGTPGFYFLEPMTPHQPARLGPSAPPSTVVGPWVVIDQVSLSPSGCMSNCVATVVTANVTTITTSGTASGAGIPVGKGDARNRLRFHTNGVKIPNDDEPDDDLDDVPDGYWATHWDSDDFGTKIDGFYRVHVFVSLAGSPVELGFADVQIVPDRVSAAAFRKIDRTELVPLRSGHTLQINFQIQPAALSRCANVVCATPDACHAPGMCDPASGLCSAPVLPNGTACGAVNACGRTDACLDGVCVADVCIPCSDAGGCPAAEGCVAHACGSCAGDGDCAGSSVGGLCRADGRCAECLTDLDCAGNAAGSLCRGDGKCVECLADTDCPGDGAPQCNAAGRCGACSGPDGEAACQRHQGRHCEDSSVPLALNGTCVVCRGERSYAATDCPASSPLCNAATDTCGACDMDGTSQCVKFSSTLVCDNPASVSQYSGVPASGACIGCITDADCSDPGAAHCISKVCVGL
jgi:hypothetical protein